MTAERRLALLEAKAATTKPGRSPAQERIADRVAACLVKGIPIPARLKAEFCKIPREGPLSPALQAMYDDVMGTGKAVDRAPRLLRTVSNPGHSLGKS